MAPNDRPAGTPLDRDFSSLAEHHPDSIIRYDAEGRITFLNQRLQSDLGVHDAAEVLGKRPREAWPDGRFDRIEAAVRAAIAQGVGTVVEFTEPTPDGDAIHHHVRVVPEYDAHGRRVGAWAFGGRVTELRRAEQAANKSATMFRSLAENSPDIIIRYGADGRAIYHNPTLPRTVRGWRALVDGAAPDASHAALQATLRRVLASGQRETVEVQLPTPHDAPASHEIILVPERDGDGAVSGALCLGRDVTRRKRLERELGDVLRCAHAFVAHAEVTAGPGWDPRDPEGTAAALEWRSTYDDVEVAQALFPLEASPDDYAEAWARAAHPDDHLAERRGAARALAAGETSFVTQFRAIDREGTEHWFEQVASVEPVEPSRWRITAINTDVTRARALQEHLRQTQKLEAMGLLAGGVAHDFNNIIAAILLQAEILDQEDQLSTDGREVLRELRDTADRAAQLVRQLLTFSRKQVMQADVHDLNVIIGNFSKMLRRFVREDIALDLRLTTEVADVSCDVGMMEQVVMNLASNACDAMPKGGHLVVSTSVEVVAEDDTASPARLRAGEHVCLRVSDSGTGIAAEVLPRIFDPFFTTKDHGKGTGLGLATVFGIVQQHNGTIHVDSYPGVGSTFSVYLPRARAPTRAADAAPERCHTRGVGCILLVEDNSAVRNATRMVLERSGYRVLEAHDGVGALAAWDAHGPAIDLVLTDMIMPGGLTGRELAARLRSQAPSLSVIFTSGYTEETAELDGESFLAKPCPPHLLLETVRGALTRARARQQAPSSSA